MEAMIDRHGNRPLISLSYDLHIHSCLSPCADDDMTPCNIAGMAALKGLDVIAVTDHNSCKNCPAVLAAAAAMGILAVPGMELTTSEEVHALCLFDRLDGAMAFDSYVDERLISVRNREDIFGRQLIYDSSDQLCAQESRLLTVAADISFDGLWELVRSFGGVMIPAHIDKASNSLLSNLGFIPPDSRFTAAEVKDPGQLQTLKMKNPYLDSCLILHNSDAHQLGGISEPQHLIRAGGRTAGKVLDYIGRRC